MQVRSTHSEKSTPAPVRALLAGLILLASGVALWDAARNRGFLPEPDDPPPMLAPEALAEAERVIEDGVGSAYPGAAVAFGVADRIERVTAVGRVAWSSRAAPVSADATLYDLASLTKAMATTVAVLLLAEDGTIDLDEPVRKTLPAFEGRWKDRVTWRHLLTHTSGLPAASRVNGDDPRERARRLLRTRLAEPPGRRVLYSDIGFIVLWEAASAAAGEPLPALLRRRVWEPLGMESTRFSPGEDCRECAPTLVLRSGEPFRGRPSDGTARLLGGVTGSAGLFASVRDVARFTAMIANGGELGGVRVLEERTVEAMLRQQSGAGRRTLGWVSFCPEEEGFEDQGRPCDDPIAYGHTGWSGTSIWVDPETKVWTVVLSNRTLGRSNRPPSLEELRREVFGKVRRES